VPDEEEWEQETGMKFSLSIFIKVYKVVSALLFTISRNFEVLYQDPFIGLIDDGEFKSILKHKGLNVGSEDQVVRAFHLWL